MSIPGIPNIPDFKGLVTSGTDAIISFGGAFLIRKVFGNQWGVYNQFGIPVLLVDTVYSLKFQNSSQVCQAPVEKGTFTSYNKVQNPYQATVTLVRGGGDATLRGAFIAQLDALSKSTLLFNIVTPDYVHRNCAIVGYDYAREPQGGARMIAANLHLEEVRESQVQFLTVETANPDDSPPVQVGEQQPQEAPQSVLSRVVDSISQEGGLLQSAETLLQKAEEAYSRFTQGSLGVLTP